MKTGEKGVTLIKSFEALKLRAYLCPAGVWTIGYGHTATAKKGMVITKEAALDLLKQDLNTAENAVNNLAKTALNQNEFDALVSFVFNVGVSAFAKSTLLKRLNAGKRDDVPGQLARWNRANGRVLPGLTRRRAEEAALFMSNVAVGKMPQKLTTPNIFNR